MFSKSKKINVLVTSIGGGGHGEQVLKALRLSRLKNLRIFGADANPICPQKRFVEEFSILPRAYEDNYQQKLFGLINKWNVNVLIHGSEPELKVFCGLRDSLSELGVLTLINNNDVVNLCMNKLQTNTRINELGFMSPRSLEIRNTEDLGQVCWFPVVVKPIVGGGGSADVFICQNSRELENLAAYLNLEERDIRFLVQEYVGNYEDEYTVGVLSTLNGTFVNSIAVKRHMTSQLNFKWKAPNRTPKVDLGKDLVISSGVSQGEIGVFPHVTAQCEEIAAALGSTGPMNIQCRLVKGNVNVFEINPRFSGTTSLRALVGFNEPEVLIRHHLLGEEVEPRFPYKSATIIRGLHEYLI